MARICRRFGIGNGRIDNSIPGNQESNENLAVPALSFFQLALDSQPGCAVSLDTTSVVTKAEAMIEKLKQLGWGDYEARAYLALLRCHPATGYRIGKESGVPTAKVYEALARLSERGAARVLPAAEGESARYIAVPPEEVLAGLRARHLTMLDELGRELTTLLARADAPDSEWLRGLAPILGRANALLANARKSVTVALPSAWEG